MLGYDPLAEYHLYNPELKLYSILEEIRDLIIQSRTREVRNNGNKKKQIIEKVQCLLTDAAGKRILDMLCRKENVNLENDHSKDSDFNNSIYKSPAIVLQLLFLQAILDSYALVSQTLDLDNDEVKQALEHLKLAFNIGDPLVWIQNFLNKNTRYKKILEKSVLFGHEETGQASDTAEERKLKKRKKKKIEDSSNPTSTA
jgi:hypothetical protein